MCKCNRATRAVARRKCRSRTGRSLAAAVAVVDEDLLRADVFEVAAAVAVVAAQGVAVAGRGATRHRCALAAVTFARRTTRRAAGSATAAAAGAAAAGAAAARATATGTAATRAAAARAATARSARAATA